MSARRRGAAALLLTAALLLATPAAAGAAGHTPDELGQNLAAARAVTAAYHNTDQAMADGYLPPAEGSVLDACITLPDAGMGVHSCCSRSGMRPTRRRRTCSATRCTR